MTKNFWPSSGMITRVLPRAALATGLVSIGSGLILIFQYRPFGDVFAQVEAITTLIPYGWFFRRIHFLSGEACVVLTLLHVLDHFVRGNDRLVSMVEWARLWLASALAFFLLFTGYVLKGDKEGLLAGTILQNLAASIPLVGQNLGSLFIGSGPDFFFFPYLWHCWLAPLALGVLLRSHIRSWLPRGNFLLIAFLLCGLGAMIIPMPLALPPQAVVQEAYGPWFFLGLQEMLKYFPPLWAGVIWPGFLALIFLGLPLTRGRGRQVARLGLYGALAVYTVLTLAVYMQRSL
ncbi:MAG: cytochrome b N-terminal domain-containing protein [Desulfovermiculus sp.]|nr:cytochrome b N-terminal domain-containing protein [Desulfovermiculus sp.]